MSDAPMVGEPGLEGRRALARQVRERLESAFEQTLGGRSRSHQLRDGDDGPLRVSTQSLLERCPRRLANPADDYVDSTATVRRRLGLLALRRLSEAGDGTGGRPAPEDPAMAVREVLRDRAGWQRSLREWFDGLERAGRVAVEAAVVTWCAEALRLTGHDHRIKWADPFLAPRWNAPGGSVQVRAPVDAVLGTPRTGEKLLVVTDALPGPGDRVRAGHPAVVHALGSGRAPVRVSLGSPSTGRVERVVVDADLLDLVVDRIAEVVGHLAAPETAPPVPGSWCRHCHLLAVCEQGAGHLRLHDAAMASIIIG